MTTENLDWKTAAGGRRWTTAVAEAVLLAWSSSGLSRSEFAMLHGIHEQRLYQWRWRLAKRGRATSEGRSPAPFREVRLTEARSEERFEVVLPSGLVLRIPAGFDVADLNRLLLALLGNG